MIVHKGQIRIPIRVLLNGRLTDTPTLIARVGENHPILDLLPTVDSAPNMVLTPGGKYYQDNLILAVNVTNGHWGPWARALPINNPAIARKMPHFNVSKPEDLRSGKYSTVNILANIPNLHKWKCGKRIKLFTGWMVAGEHPYPSTIAELANAPDGVIYISQEYASRFKLHSRFGNIVPLQNGDKLAGALPNGWAIKGSASIVPNLKYDMVVPTDAIKLRDVPCTEYTRFWVRERASERFSPTARLSYQAGQFIPGVIHDRILHSLDLDYKESGLSVRGILLKLSLGNWDDSLRNALIKMFEYPTVDDNGVEVIKDNHWGQLIKAGHTPYIDNDLMRGIQKELRLILDSFINPRVSGVWGVLMPYHRIDTISIPIRAWVAMRHPKEVAALRYPIKGHTSIIKFKVDVHSDGTDIRVHPKVVELCWNGDHDGDLVEVIANRDIVDAAVSPRQAMKANHAARNITTTVGTLTPELEALNIAESQCVVAEWGSAVGLSTTIRDNMIGNGGTEEECLRFFEAVMQPALAQKEGAIPIATHLMANPGLIAVRANIPQHKFATDSKVLWASSPMLRELAHRKGRNYKLTLEWLATQANLAKDRMSAGIASRHEVILSAFADLVVPTVPK